MIPSMSLESDSGSTNTGSTNTGSTNTGTAGTADTGTADSDSGLERSGQRFRLLDDPVAIRALAHPLRQELLSITGRAGQITTAAAARELGISHGLASHHLRQLAKYGFVGQVAGRDNRERPWRLTHTSMSWRGADATPEGAAAAAAARGLAGRLAAARRHRPVHRLSHAARACRTRRRHRLADPALRRRAPAR